MHRYYSNKSAYTYGAGYSVKVGELQKLRLLIRASTHIFSLPGFEIVDITLFLLPVAQTLQTNHYNAREILVDTHILLIQQACHYYRD